MNNIQRLEQWEEEPTYSEEYIDDLYKKTFEEEALESITNDFKKILKSSNFEIEVTFEDASISTVDFLLKWQEELEFSCLIEINKLGYLVESIRPINSTTIGVYMQVTLS